MMSHVYLPLKKIQVCQQFVLSSQIKQPMCHWPCPTRYSTTTRQPQPPFRVRLDWVCMRGLEASNSVSFQQGELWSHPMMSSQDLWRNKSALRYDLSPILTTGNSFSRHQSMKLAWDRTKQFCDAWH